MFATGVLAESVLVLNKSYAPINVIPLYRAISLLSRERAEVVYIENGYYKSYNLTSWLGFTEMKNSEGLTSDNDIVYGIEKKLLVPKIIRTLYFDKVPHRSVVLTRRNVFLRDDFTCMFCGKKLPSQELNIDHIIPKCKGGKTTWENVVCSCFRCNNKKGSKSLEESKMKLIRKPYKPKYSLAIFERIKEPKYKAWKDFISQAYWNTPLEK